MAENERKTISVDVKLLTGKHVTLELEPGSKILELKEQLKYKEGIPVDQQQLVWLAHRLSDNEMTLEEAKIGQGAVIHMILCRGG
jgi:hypothetical protein